MPLGPIVCISPWNFPLAIFTGQIAAALVAGNPVLAKPAEETPLIAAQGVRILYDAGIPPDVLQFLPGDRRIGAALVASPETCGVVFTGSTEVARLIQAQLASRLLPNGKPIPLIAETGGQNAMIVDSSALAEQVVLDVIASAFDSAGQRCSALRVLCLQEEVADRMIAMLKGALRELSIGSTDRIKVDIGPVITDEAKRGIDNHIEDMRSLGRKVDQLPLGPEAANGTFVGPAIIEIKSLRDLKREVFGPVLHVVRYKRDELDRLIDDINATGYGLTFGLHTRLDETIAYVTERIRAGNIYINRNVIGAVVGVQPFGGRGLSGTGPKAGGPLYLGRLVENAPALPHRSPVDVNPVLTDFAKWLGQQGRNSLAHDAREAGRASALGLAADMPGPVGERNIYAMHPRGRILLAPLTEVGLFRQLTAALASGNEVAIDAACLLEASLAALPPSVAARVSWSKDWLADAPFAAALIEGDSARTVAVTRKIAALPGPLVGVQAANTQELEASNSAYCQNWLLEEVSTSINTTAAGGNASLMAVG